MFRHIAFRLETCLFSGYIENFGNFIQNGKLGNYSSIHQNFIKKKHTGYWFFFFLLVRIFWLTNFWYFLIFICNISQYIRCAYSIDLDGKYFLIIPMKFLKVFEIYPIIFFRKPQKRTRNVALHSDFHEKVNRWKELLKNEIASGVKEIRYVPLIPVGFSSGFPYR